MIIICKTEVCITTGHSLYSITYSKYFKIGSLSIFENLNLNKCIIKGKMGDEHAR